jgi:hypothetical protein
MCLELDISTATIKIPFAVLTFSSSKDVETDQHDIVEQKHYSGELKGNPRDPGEEQGSNVRDISGLGMLHAKLPELIRCV